MNSLFYVEYLFTTSNPSQVPVPHKTYCTTTRRQTNPKADKQTSHFPYPSYLPKTLPCYLPRSHFPAPAPAGHFVPLVPGSSPGVCFDGPSKTG